MMSLGFVCAWKSSLQLQSILDCVRVVVVHIFTTVNIVELKMSDHKTFHNWKQIRLQLETDVTPHLLDLSIGHRLLILF